MCFFKVKKDPPPPNPTFNEQKSISDMSWLFDKIGKGSTVSLQIVFKKVLKKISCNKHANFHTSDCGSLIIRPTLPDSCKTL